MTTEVAESESNQQPSEGRKSFIEPELSSPVDVLEATTFFQGPASGVI